MLRFKKGVEPPEFAKERKAGSTWTGTTSRMWHADLLAEQARLCAYCQRRISSGLGEPQGSDMHVEHWVSQHTGALTMDWWNVLGVCTGDERKDTNAVKGELHCDTHRGGFTRGDITNPSLSLHPVIGQGQDPAPSLRYDNKGVASAVDAGVSDDMEALNLNAKRLVRAREAAYSELIERLNRKTDPGQRYSLVLLKDEYAFFARGWRDGTRPEQADVLRYFIRRWAKKLHKVTLNP